MSDTHFDAHAARSAPWRRWDMSAIDAPVSRGASAGSGINTGASSDTGANVSVATGTATAASPPAAEPDAAQLAALVKAATERVREAARQEGFEAGRQAGETAGHDAGQLAGHAQGHAKGYAAGLAQARAEVTEETVRLRGILSSAGTAVTEIEESLGDALIDLAVDIARQVVRRELSLHPDVICAVVGEILHAVPATTPGLKIWLNPADLDLVQCYLTTEHAHASWRLFADPSIACGGCRAETSYGAIDATLQTRWQRVAAGLSRDSAWLVVAPASDTDSASQEAQP